MHSYIWQKGVSGNYNRSQPATHTHTIVHCGTELPVVDHPCPPLVVLPQHSSLLLFRQGHTKVGVEAALELGVCKSRERERQEAMHVCQLCAQCNHNFGRQRK